MSKSRYWLMTSRGVPFGPTFTSEADASQHMAEVKALRPAIAPYLSLREVVGK